ncbi:TPA: DUF2586 family protein [Enterobacter kobei]|nr:DUF2586 family protein [Enterobacter kobei]
MTWPGVDVNQLNMRQGAVAEIERVLLFVGHAADVLDDQTSPVIAVNAQSDIAASLDKAGDALRENVLAAQINAGQNWQAWVLLLEPSEKDYPGAIEAVISSLSVEGAVVIPKPGTAVELRELFADLQDLRASLISKLGRWVWFIVSVPGAEETAMSWGDYHTYLSTLQKDIAANAVMPVPALWGNETGVLSGRLCNRTVTIADSPARVATGALLGMSTLLPVDKDGVEVDLAWLRAFHDLRYSVPMWYPDYEGLYWADGRMLEVTGGDYTVIEYIRIVDKAARNVRIQAIGKIANRNLNTTPASVESHKTFFGRTLRDMSRSTQINGVTFPGEIEPPNDGSVSITWVSKTKVAIGIVVRPYACPKEISVSIVLDASLEE